MARIDLTRSIGACQRILAVRNRPAHIAAFARPPRGRARQILGPVAAAEVLARGAEEGVSEDALDRASVKLGVEKRKQGKGGWVWSLPLAELPPLIRARSQDRKKWGLRNLAVLRSWLSVGHSCGRS